MTYIEFFVKDAVENICACLTQVPDRVIIIGDKRKQMKAQCRVYEELFAQRGYNVEFDCRSVSKNNLQDILDVLTEMLDTYDDCAFGLTGGDELYLVAMGILFERYRDKKIQMHRFNIRNNTIFDCDQDGNTIWEGEAPALSIAENMQIYGGTVVEPAEDDDTGYAWSLEDGFDEDIEAMWEICRKNPKHWNIQMSLFAAGECVENNPISSMELNASVPSMITYLQNNQTRYTVYPEILRALYEKGLLLAYEYDDRKFSVVYKNEQVKRCLTKAGQALELKMYLTALMVKEKDEEYTYNDVMNGVTIDWDGETGAEERYDVRNEVDVVMMHGMVPVFVSCKNGWVEIEELYKLNTVASRFGGKYAKKVLVATALDPKSPYTLYIKDRAAEMGIRVLDDLQEMNDEELTDTVRNLWR